MGYCQSFITGFRSISSSATCLPFHMDGQYRYEQIQRLHSTRAHRSFLGMVPEPGRSFLKQFAQMFWIRTLHDKFLDRRDFVRFLNKFILQFTVHRLQLGYSSSQGKLFHRLYVEITVLTARRCITQKYIQHKYYGKNITYLGIIFENKACYF